MMDVYEVPENQLTIFDMLQDPQESKAKLFSEDKANWHQESHWIQYMPNDWVCGVVGIIPKYVLSPMEKGVREGYPSNDWGEQVDIWSDYVYSISQLIPYHERGKEDANGWSAACEMLKSARDQRKPIEMAIWKRSIGSFKDLEVVEYLQKKKSEDEINASNS